MDLGSLLTLDMNWSQEKVFVVEATGTENSKFKEDFSPGKKNKNNGLGALKGQILKIQINWEKEWWGMIKEF